jgi:predicted helicase
MQSDAKPGHNPKASAKLFHAFAAAGQQLAGLHVNYESAREFKLQRIEYKEVKLGNRGALEWVIDQYRVTRDAQGNTSMTRSWSG